MTTRKETNLNLPSQARESAHSRKPLPLTQPWPQNNICFADPREKPRNVFELCLRKMPPVLYGWKEVSRAGSMYVHFNQNCLEQLDSENFPAKRLDVSCITINKHNYKELNEKRQERTKRLRHSIFVKKNNQALII